MNVQVLGGEYELAAGNALGPFALLVGAGLLGLMLLFTYWAYRAHGPWFWLIPAGARLLAVGLLALCISQPLLKSTRTVVARGRVPVLLDASRSMGLEDLPGGRSRHEQALRLLLGPDETLLDRLSRRFDVELFEFADDVRVAPGREPAALSRPEGPATWIGPALREVSARRAEAALAAVVLLSDGQDNSAENVTEAARACGAPILAIGLGAQQEAAPQDLALVDLAVERTVLAGSRTLVEIAVASRGISALAPMTLTCAGKAVAEAVARVEPGQKETVRLEFLPREPGQFVCTLSTPARPEELTGDNNRCSFTLEVIERRFTVLYVEGMMRWEYKFLRRALLQDPDLRLESYLRTGPGRFYHQPDPRSEGKPADAGGQQPRLPLSADELADFDLVLWGDLAATHFTTEQFENLARFVSDRGGGFLMLGGQSSFASGGYQNTPLEKVLPVFLRPEGDLQSPGEFRPVLTPEGLQHPILQFDKDPELNQALWAALPPLNGCNRTGPAKPGALSLLVRRSARRIQAPDLLLAVQRYGKGKSAALTVDTTWHWDFEILGKGGDSTAYRQFWAQLTRWLLPDPDTDPRSQRPVRVATDQKEYRQAQLVRAEARVLVAGGAAGLELAGTLTNPDGGTSPVTFQPSETPGIYAASWLPRATGAYQVSVRASAGGQLLGTDTAGFLVGEASHELQSTDLQEELLRSLAEMSGGQYFRPENCGKLPAAVPEVRKETIKTQRTRLWNSPLLLVAFVTLATVEWLVRRYAVRP